MKTDAQGLFFSRFEVQDILINYAKEKYPNLDIKAGDLFGVNINPVWIHLQQIDNHVRDFRETEDYCRRFARK